MVVFKKRIRIGIHIIDCNCGHEFEINELKDDEVREVVCPSCKGKSRIGKLKMKSVIFPPDES
jgi:DNA-directed RNA polymerase subunit RPC12/RpoP